ncbi:MAG TPA: L-threonylcarbamoyladenylate synthase [Candidatus Saccharimonadales bacterium]|nr:L-threonylcarbamoyladenylate synthase [Candidatus Saccharimonadales bacterium]
MDTFEEATKQLSKSGAVGVIPTDTVYGLVARADDPEAVRRLYGLKEREGKPGTLIACCIDHLVRLGLKGRYLKAVANYWPGPVSIIIPCGPELAYLHQGAGSLAVRVPDDGTLVDFLEQTGPLLTSSANHPGRPVSTTIEEARAYFGGRVDFYVDGGNLSGHQPSTIIRVVDDAIEVLREGAVKIENNGIKQ